MPKISRPIRLSDKQLEEISKPSAFVKEAARALWIARVPSRWKPLLDSQTLTPGAVLTTPFVWDASSRRYIDRARRRYIPFSEIRDQAIEPMIQSIKAEGRALGAGLQESGDLATWESGMIDRLKLAQTAAGLAANGGISSSSPDDDEKIAALILFLLLLLRDFAYEIYTGKQPINGLLFVRSDLYAAAARDSFEEARRHSMAVYFGATEERRRLGRAEHCHTDEDLEGCVELADLGWQPIGSLPRLGDTPCRTNCHCRFDYRYKDESGDWVIVDDSATAAKILRELWIKESVDE